ncbi:MAG: glycosyltransferase family 2 protein [Candidatus Omnitrophica bacterium]|nr:glycosyltransferase family 2 protein [Candidatus Omnitrophota bacterium]
MKNLSLSVVMPVYNEKETIGEMTGKVLAVDIVKELIIVDDGSVDGTRDILKSWKPDPRIKILFHDKNQGKGAALQTGFREARGDVIVIQDADLEYEPEEFREMIAPIQKGRADVVYGSRLTSAKPQRAYLFWHKVGNTLVTLFAGILYNTTLTDIETCYKMFRADLLKDLKIESNGFEVEPELTAKLLKKKLRIYEVPISYYGRSYEEGKKIFWWHGFGALWTLVRYKFTK